MPFSPIGNPFIEAGDGEAGGVVESVSIDGCGYVHSLDAEASDLDAHLIEVRFLGIV